MTGGELGDDGASEDAARPDYKYPQTLLGHALDPLDWPPTPAS